jgi:hypothetical protein
MRVPRARAIFGALWPVVLVGAVVGGLLVWEALQPPRTPPPCDHQSFFYFEFGQTGCDIMESNMREPWRSSASIAVLAVPLLAIWGVHRLVERLHREAAT